MTPKDEPLIIGFLCNWCSYAGADLAGVSRFQYKPNLRVIKVMCSGMINPVYVIRALLKGADGVLVSGCHIGDCHYGSGNFYARRRFLILKKLLEFVGIESERLQMSWVSAAEGKKWAEVCDLVIDKVKQVGPSPFKQL